MDPTLFDGQGALMTKADQKRLASTLADAGLSSDSDTCGRIFAELMRLRQAHIARDSAKYPGGGGRPSRELLKVNAALRAWLPEKWFTVEQCLIHRFDPIKMEAMVWLREATTEAIEQLDGARPKRKTEDPDTTLFRELYDIYCRETGKSGLKDGGPAHRFVTGCARIVYESVILPKSGFRQRLQAKGRKAIISKGSKNRT